MPARGVRVGGGQDAGKVLVRADHAGIERQRLVARRLGLRELLLAHQHRSETCPRLGVARRSGDGLAQRVLGVRQAAGLDIGVREVDQDRRAARRQRRRALEVAHRVGVRAARLVRGGAHQPGLHQGRIALDRRRRLLDGAVEVAVVEPVLRDLRPHRRERGFAGKQGHVEVDRGFGHGPVLNRPRFTLRYRCWRYDGVSPDESGPISGGMPTETPVILWFRNDLRLRDHAALTAAVETGRPVLPVYVLDETAAGAWAPGGASRWWLHHSLASLDKALAERGSRLVLRRGDSVRILSEIAGEIGAEAIHTGVPVEPWARALNDAVAKALPGALPGALHTHRTATLFDLSTIRTQSGGVYGVFTPFARACRAQPLPDALPLPRRFATPDAPRGDRLEEWGLLPTRPDWAGGLRKTWRPGEAGAAARVTRFLEHLQHYDRQRNLPGQAGTSMLSPHLHWGEISPVQVWHVADRHGGETGPAGRDAFLNEVLWREFSAYLLWHHRTLPERPLRPEFAHMPWRHDKAALAAWQRGRTGVPIVDAGMRQLWHTGWMHNRVRMIVGSFLVKHLLVRWQDGETWFWDTLCDADLASNAASWQWIAGCGADAAPFFRVFNPVLQGQKFDPHGTYVRRFVPELAELDARHIHAPWDAPAMLLQSAGVTLGQNYPLPIVDLAEGRQRALDAFRTVSRESAA